VEAVLRSGSRPVERVLIAVESQRAAERFPRLQELTARHKVRLERVAAGEISALARGTTHGGVVALVGPRRHDALEELAAERDSPLVVMLDGVEDPYNLGAAVRSLYAAGVDGLVLRERAWEGPAAAVVARASAGASELMPTAVVDAPESAAEVMRSRGFRIACTAARPSALPVDEANLVGSLFLLIGGERRGVTRSFLAAADLVLRIRPGRHDAPELGVAAAAAIISHEALRQRRARR
jgi:23S rRNA (guanosine2251-2'-O)-methyltransferase